jgi:hypothetical protein
MALDLGMPGSEEGRQVAAHAGSDQADRAAGQKASGHRELAGDGQVLEIAGGEIGDLHQGAPVRQVAVEVTGLAGERAGGESVEVEDGFHFLAAGCGSSSVNLISASALNSLKGS